MYLQNIAVLRVLPLDPPEVDEDNLPVLADPVVIATVAGLIAPISMTEQAQLGDAGATAANYSGFLDPTDVLPSDKLQDVTTSPDGPIYEIRSLNDWSAYPVPFLELTLWRANS